MGTISQITIRKWRGKSKRKWRPLPGKVEKNTIASDSLLSLLSILPRLGGLVGRLSPARMGAAAVEITNTSRQKRDVTRGLTSWCVSAPHVWTVVARPFCIKTKRNPNKYITLTFCRHIISVLHCSAITDSSSVSNPRSHRGCAGCAGSCGVARPGEQGVTVMHSYVKLTL